MTPWGSRGTRVEAGGPWELFLGANRLVEQAKDALMEAVPTARSPGRPLADALAEFEGGLRLAESRMSAWRDSTTEPAWQACRMGLAESLGAAAALRLAAPDLGFEALMATLGDLIAPLDAFHAGAEGMRRGSRRSTGGSRR